MKITHFAETTIRTVLRACAAASILAAADVPAQAQSFSELYEFPQNGGQGGDPSQMSMIQATDGNFYGTMFTGGLTDNYGLGGGTLFKVTSSGQLTLLWAFCAQSGCPDGRSPEGGMVQASDGNFYGTTTAGGTYNGGTIYRIKPNGKLTTLYNFCWYPNTCSPYSGANPQGALIQASNGDLYGTTVTGTAFKISANGKFTLLYTWPGGNGSVGALLQVGDGDMYGTTEGGGANGEGSVFRMTLKGTVTTLYSFCSQQPDCADGSEPVAGLVQGSRGVLYGTTVNGGASYGTVFKITPQGAFTSLVSFQAGTTPANPYAPLILGSDGTLYGTTAYGGNPADGFVFQIANDTLANAFLFPGTTGCVGGRPYGGLLQSTDGNFYGSDSGSCSDDGTLFKFSTGLRPFVTTIPAYGAPGASIIIQGTNLSGATSVSFRGTKAEFTIMSASEIKTTVPAGADSGEVKVITPGGKLLSNVAFKILK